MWDLGKIYVGGVYVSENHIEDAWAQIGAGVKPEHAASFVLPSSKRINSASRAAYRTALVTILTLKSELFAIARAESKRGGDWRRSFRGRRRIFWPSPQERKALGLADYSSHEVRIIEPHRRKPITVRMTVDHSKKSVVEATILDLDGRAT